MTKTTQILFQDAVPCVAGVTVYEFTPGRFTVSKQMITTIGNRHTMTSYFRKISAIAYAKKFLLKRATKAGTTYVPGSGVNTLGFKPILH